MQNIFRLQRLKRILRREMRKVMINKNEGYRELILIPLFHKNGSHFMMRPVDFIIKASRVLLRTG